MNLLCKGFFCTSGGNFNRCLAGGGDIRIGLAGSPERLSILRIDMTWFTFKYPPIHI